MGSFGIHPKFSGTIPKEVGTPFARTNQAFQGVWNDSQHLPKSTLFKTMGYSPGFLLKIGGFRTLRNSPQIFWNNSESSWKSICTHIGDISESLERFLDLPKSAMFKTMGYCPGFLVRIGGLRTLRNSPHIFRNNPESTCKYIYKLTGGISESLERFPTLA